MNFLIQKVLKGQHNRKLLLIYSLRKTRPKKELSKYDAAVNSQKEFSRGNEKSLKKSKTKEKTKIKHSFVNIDNVNK